MALLEVEIEGCDLLLNVPIAVIINLLDEYFKSLLILGYVWVVRIHYLVPSRQLNTLGLITINFITT